MSISNLRVVGEWTATYKYASLMLCFDPFEPRKFKSQIKTNAEVNATGVVHTPGVCRGQIKPSRTLLGVLDTYQRGYSDSVCSFERAS